MGKYHLQPVEELAKQLAAGLARLRQGYIDAAEDLLGIVQPDLEYPYEFILFRLTGYRPSKPQPIQPLPGKALRHDLRLMILDICESFDLPAAVYGPEVYDLSALAGRFNVSVKTVQRWRHRGLVARKLVFPDGRKRLAFVKRSLRDFARCRRRQLLRSVRFSQMHREEVEFMIRRARRMAARTGCSLLEASRRLARRTGRAVETVRYTLRNHDRAHPENPIFPGHEQPLDLTSRQAIYRCFLHGVSVTALAAQYRRTRGSIYRIINEVRAEQLLSREIDYVYNPQFDLPGAHEQIMGEEFVPAPAAPAPARPPVADPNNEGLVELCQDPLLTAAQERSLFRQYNFVKFQADRLRKALQPGQARSGELRQIERLLVQADAIKNHILRANLRLVVSISRRHLRGAQTLPELVSDGTISLMKAVEKFDFARGFKFSTYASWAIIKNFARSVPHERYMLDRHVLGSEEMLDTTGGLNHYDPRAVSVIELRDSLEVVLAQLSPRERAILVQHYGLDQQKDAQTLEQLSRHMGISKERVRQIEIKAMGKLRDMLGPHQRELLG